MSRPGGGLLLVVSSPSGAGKTTLCRRLMAECPELRFSVSYTTRAPRAGERDGVDYHFVSEAQFTAMANRGEFAEWAHVHGRRYGTATRTVQEALSRHEQVLFDVDYQGAERLLASFPEDARLVYILPPSLTALAQRLRGRGTEAAETVALRLRKAQEELSHFRSYHYLVMNDDLERGYRELRAVYLTEWARVRGGEPPPEAAELAQGCLRGLRGALAEALLREADVVGERIASLGQAP